MSRVRFQFRFYVNDVKVSFVVRVAPELSGACWLDLDFCLDIALVVGMIGWMLEWQCIDLISFFVVRKRFTYFLISVGNYGERS